MTERDEEPPEHPDVEAARRDPRLSLGREAMIRDWSEAMKVAERTRRWYELGLACIVRFDRTGDVDDQAQRAVRARREIAQAELANELAEMNAMTLVAMVSALDALVEELVPQAREALAAMQVNELYERVNIEHPEIFGLHQDREEDVKSIIRAAVDAASTTLLPKLKPQPRGSGVTRWEEVLEQAGLQAKSGRPIPFDLDEALGEVVQLRNVIAHRASRVDEWALGKAPSLSARYAEDQLVGITRGDYRKYSAALWTYGEEIVRRVLGSAGPTEIPLSQWRTNYSLNA